MDAEFLEPPRLERVLRSRILVLVDGVPSAQVEAELEAVRRSSDEQLVVASQRQRRSRDRVVKSGQQVVLELQGPGLQITAVGRAKKSGRVGDEIPVENLISGIVVRGVVKSEGRVQVYWSPVTGLAGVREP